MRITFVYKDNYTDEENASSEQTWSSRLQLWFGLSLAGIKADIFEKHKTMKRSRVSCLVHRIAWGGSLSKSGHGAEISTCGETTKKPRRSEITGQTDNINGDGFL